MIGVTDQDISKAFELSNMAGDFYFENKLYKGVAMVRK